MAVPIPRWITLTVAGLLGLGPLLAACGDDGASSDGTAVTTTLAPEEIQVPMAEVLDGMPAMLQAAEAAEAAAEAGDFGAVLARYEELHEVWEEIEGTVKATDRDLYEVIETAQSLIKDGGENEDAARVATGVTDHAAAVETFIEDNR